MLSARTADTENPLLLWLFPEKMRDQSRSVRAPGEDLRAVVQALVSVFDELICFETFIRLDLRLVLRDVYAASFSPSKVNAICSVKSIHVIIRVLQIRCPFSGITSTRTSSALD